MKYHIEKNTVQETLVIPLYGRKMCSELFPQLFRDETAIRLMDQIDYDFSTLAQKSQSTVQQFGFLELAMRQNDLAWEVRDYLKKHPKAAVVNLGCGLDDTGRSCDNGCCKLYNLDFPDVIAVRDALLPAGEREENIPCDLNDYSWFDRIDASGGAVFFAAGVFYYFLTKQFQTLVQAMAQAFPGGRLVFDAAGKAAVKMMLKTWIRDAEIKDVGAYFSVSDARRELSPWAPGLQVSSRGYMLGYQSLDDPSVKGLYRLLARIGDGWMKMQIVRMEFGGLV
jgi:O-methyltransferase involved in polyketide biosynthesis